MSLLPNFAVFTSLSRLAPRPSPAWSSAQMTPFSALVQACCSTRRCEAIAEDNGILCRHRRHAFELRSGMEQVRALLPSFEKVRALLPSERMRKPDKSTGKRSADASTVRDMQPYAAARAAKATAKIDKATAKANRRMGFG